MARREPRVTRATFVTLWFGTLVVNFQNFMVVPALPEVGNDLGSSTAWTTWVLTGFLLGSAVASPILGKLGDQLGKRRVLLASVLIFFVGAVGAAFAPNIAVLIAFRTLQGFGNAINPLSISILREHVPRERLRSAVAFNVSALPIGTGLALLSGVLVDLASWRFLFAVAAAAVGVALLLAYRFIPESPERRPTRPDILGGILLAAGLVCLLLALTKGVTWGWTAPQELLLFGTAGALLAIWLVVEHRTPEPMVDLRMLASRPILMTNLTTMIGTSFAVTGAIVLIPRLLATPGDVPDAVSELVGYGFGASTTMVGLYMLPWAVFGVFATPLANGLGRRFGSKCPMSLGLVLIALGLGAVALWHDETWQVLLAIGVVGLGFPLSAAGSAHVIVESVPAYQAGTSSGMQAVIRQIGGTTGAQLSAAVLGTSLIVGTAIPTEGAMVAAFALCATAALVGSVLALFVTPLRSRGRKPGPAPG